MGKLQINSKENSATHITTHIGIFRQFAHHTHRNVGFLAAVWFRLTAKQVKAAAL